jgi:mono/diheme cytochrome c family protein
LDQLVPAGLSSCAIVKSGAVVLKRLGWVVAVILALVGVVTLGVGAIFLRQGIGARVEPSSFEATVARTLRSMAIPRSARGLQNPVALTDEVIADGRAHFADHCASCHANDGSGDIDMGRSLSPRAPDMRAAGTQQLTDGELFYIIENGIRLTGMPAWGNGTPEGEASSWHLVHFIRRLPNLTAAEIDEMAAMNPRSAAQWREEEEIQKFLEGESAPQKTPSSRREHGGHE